MTLTQERDRVAGAFPFCDFRPHEVSETVSPQGAVSFSVTSSGTTGIAGTARYLAELRGTFRSDSAK